MISNANRVVQSSHVVLSWYEADIDLSGQPLGRKRGNMKTKRITKLGLGIVFGQRVHSVWIEMIPALDSLRSAGFSRDDGLPFRLKL